MPHALLCLFRRTFHGNETGAAVGRVEIVILVGLLSSDGVGNLTHEEAEKAIAFDMLGGKFLYFPRAHGDRLFGTDTCFLQRLFGLLRAFRIRKDSHNVVAGIKDARGAVVSFKKLTQSIHGVFHRLNEAQHVGHQQNDEDGSKTNACATAVTPAGISVITAASGKQKYEEYKKNNHFLSLFFAPFTIRRAAQHVYCNRGANRALTVD